MDLRSHTARRQEFALDLTKTEWALLECLMRHPGQTLTRQMIVDYVWSYERDVQPTLVDVYISYLRNKLNLPGFEAAAKYLVYPVGDSDHLGRHASAELVEHRIAREFSDDIFVCIPGKDKRLPGDPISKGDELF